MVNCGQSIAVMGIFCLGLLPAAGFADELKSNQGNNEEPDYELEEMVVTAREPQWRQPKDEEDWRPDRFELPEGGPERRMEWLPEYTRDERDNYTEVRDPKNEEPDFQLFKWKF